MSEPAIDIRDVSIQFQTELGVVQALRHVSLTIQPGEIVVLVGESGCGKSVLCRSILKLLPRNSKQTTGQILLGQRNITSYTEKQMEQLRGKTLAMVFQNPLTTLNPSMTMGAQLREAICHRQQMSRAAADARASELLQLVGIADGAHRLDLLPQAFSGGQRQRCSLAIALAQEPQILIADEPTTALDVTVQLEILDLLRNLQRRQDLTILFVTHDLGVAARIADRIGIMYAGKLVEIGTADDIFYDARHPYTWGLLGALPSAVPVGERLIAIPGMPPDMLQPPRGDAFAVRNRYALGIDYETEPPMFAVSPTHQAATWLLDPRAPHVMPPPYIVRRRKHP